jgi:DNA-binding CsgD family transcriptional regulator
MPHLNNISEAVLSQMPGGIFIKNVGETSSSYLYTNPMMTKVLGYNKLEEVIGIHDYDMRSPASEAAELFNINDKKILSDGARTFLNVYPYPYGKTIGLYVIKAPYTSENREEKTVICNAIPIFRNQNILHQLTSVQGFKSGGIYEFSHNYDDLDLSKRQAECFYFTLKGKSTKEIARILSISARTVQGHIEEVKLKLSVRTRSELFDFAFEHGLTQIIPTTLFQNEIFLL